MFKLTSSDHEHELGLDAGSGAYYESCYESDESDESDAWVYYADEFGPELPADLEGIENLF